MPEPGSDADQAMRVLIVDVPTVWPRNRSVGATTTGGVGVVGDGHDDGGGVAQAAPVEVDVGEAVGARVALVGIVGQAGPAAGDRDRPVRTVRTNDDRQRVAVRVVVVGEDCQAGGAGTSGTAKLTSLTAFGSRLSPVMLTEKAAVSVPPLPSLMVYVNESVPMYPVYGS